MRIADRIGHFKVKGASFIEITLIRVDAKDLGHEHIMGSQGFDLCDPAFNIDRTFFDEGRRNVLCFLRCELELLELVHLPAGTHSAEVCGIDQAFGGQINDEFLGPFDDLI